MTGYQPATLTLHASVPRIHVSSHCFHFPGYLFCETCLPSLFGSRLVCGEHLVYFALSSTASDDFCLSSNAYPTMSLFTIELS